MADYIGDDSANTITGGAGSDLIIGRGGDDTLTGGAGSDTFKYDTRQFGDDTITDFTAGAGGDKIDLSFLKVADLASLTPFMTEDAGDVVIDLGYNSWSESIRIANVTIDQLLAANFVFNVSSAVVDTTGTGYRDVLFGGNANDILRGGNGNDALTGGAGNDTITGGGDNDALRGGTGSDIFKYDTRQFGDDTLSDFTAGAGGDKIDLSFLKVADLASLTPFMTEVAGNVIIDLGYNSWSEGILIANTTISQLIAANFVFNASTAVVDATGSGYRDVLFGGNANDILRGGNGNDSLVGGAGSDTLNGGGDEDTLRGGTGSDTFVYNTRQFGDDTIVDFTAGAGGDKIDLSFLKVADLASLTPFMTQDAADVVITLGYNSWSESIRIANTTIDQLIAANFVFNSSATVVDATGSGYRDVLFGGNASDILRGGSGNDSLVGGAGSDTLIGGSGDDVMRGGTGSDTFKYDTREFGDDRIADFTAGAGGDKIDLSFLKVADLASLTPFMSQDGGDVVIELGYDSWSESIRIGNTTIAQLTAANFIFNTSAAALTITGTGYRDVLFGGNGNDTLSGGSGDDSLVGGAGNDLLRGGTGSDRYFGGAGSDTVTYSGTTGPVTVNLQSGVGSGGEAQGDTYTGIENAIGSLGGDSLVGNAFANALQGLDGNDVLRGGAGADVIDGGAGIDTASYYYATTGVSIDLGAHTASGGEAQGDVLTGIENLTGGQANDTLAGDAGANTLTGWGGDDVLRGGAGADRLDGGAGIDTASYYSATTGVVVSLASGLGTGGEAQGDILFGIENLSGGQGWDQLYGNAGANVLQGWNGNDLLVGRGGKDTLTGGAGADRFQFTAVGDSVVGANADRITDFSHAQADRIDLAGIDANTAAAGDQGFSFIGSGAFTHHAGELRAAITAPGVTTIAGDINGDGVSDFHIQLTGAFALQAADFVL
ncbi:beta strand repeat-containing protein [Inquilinus sp. YAF38]|uniref:beta strand repeat-containing protein n=1 Tax=Inquilinus sp. YAF38 TaxID=3233084 RepID=UPI003F8F21CF